MHEPNVIIWNGISSEDLGIKVERYPALNRPGRKHTVADVPGQNGYAYVMQNAWHETVQAYEISAKAPVIAFKKVAEWLNSADGYADLFDSYDPEIYRRAVVVDGFDVENSLNRGGRAMIQFRCRPERYMRTEKIEVTTSETITNPTQHTAQPLIKIIGAGYPSMLQMTDRTRLNPTDHTYLDDLFWMRTPSSQINLTAGISEVKKNPSGGAYIECHADRISNVSVSNSSLSFTTTQPDTGVGMTVRVQPLTKYNVSVNYATSNSRNGRIEALLLTRNGKVIQSAGSETFLPSSLRQSLTFETTADTYWLYLLFLPGNSFPSSASFRFDNIQLNMGVEQPYIAYGTATASSFTIGDVKVNLSELYDYMYLDCETLNAYREETENLNPLVSFTDLNDNMSSKFPRFEKGSTAVEITAGGSIRSLEITPRFWTL